MRQSRNNLISNKTILRFTKYSYPFLQRNNNLVWSNDDIGYYNR